MLAQECGCTYNLMCPNGKGRLAQWLERLVHTEEVGGSTPPSPTMQIETIGAQAVDLALSCRGGGTADALRSGRSVLTDVWVQIPPSAPTKLTAHSCQRHRRRSHVFDG